MRRSRRTVSTWAAGGLLLPVLGGASAGGVMHATANESFVGVTPPASVTHVPQEQVARPIPSQARTAAAAAAAVTPVNLPAVLWQAYAVAVDGAPAGCHLPMSLLAAIGQVESGSLAGRALDADHRVVPPVLGPVLDGNGFAAISDSDDGRLDGDRRWDRAVGPMQFIPSTWAGWSRDGDADGKADPQDIEDAAAAAAAYLCAGGRDLATSDGLRDAILSYNHSIAYLTLVLLWKQAFEAIPPETGSIRTVAPSGVVPDPGPVVAGSGVVVPATVPAPVPDPSEPGPSQQAPAEDPAVGPTAPAPTPTGEPTASASPSGDPTSDPSPGPSSDPSPGPTSGSPCPDPIPTGDPTSPPTGDPAPEPVDTSPTTAPSQTPDPCVMPDGTPPPAS